jgi:hypothetical protein
MVAALSVVERAHSSNDDFMPTSLMELITSLFSRPGRIAYSSVTPQNDHPDHAWWKVRLG